MSSSTMKILSIVVSVAALVTTPALAATVHKGKATHHYASDPDSYASQSQRSPEVYSWDGRDLGTDPDPNIRFQLLRDQNWGGN
jgi:hypothetical protein